MITENFTTPGSSTWTCPRGVYSIDIECFGAGGGGGTPSGGTGAGGGGGGAYSKVTSFAVTPGSVYSFYVGTGGGIDTAGEDSTFNSTTCIAKGGSAASGASGGAGGAAGSGVGSTKYSGGIGATTSGNNGGGGGGGADSSGAGTNGSGVTGGINGGGAGDTYPALDGTDATYIGGGGGGAEFDSTSHTGFAGQVSISYTIRGNKSWAGGVSYQTFTMGCY